MNVPFLAHDKAREIRFEAQVIRADGTIEDRGLIAYWHANPLRRAAMRVQQKVRWLLSNGELGATVIVNGGHAIVTNRIIGAGTEPLNVGWGTGAGTAAVADTTLFTETALDLTTTTGSRTAGTSSRVTTTNTNDTYQVVATKTASGAGTVTNAGTWDNATIGSGQLYVKGDFTGIGLASGDGIQFTIKVKYA